MNTLLQLWFRRAPLRRPFVDVFCAAGSRAGLGALAFVLTTALTLFIPTSSAFAQVYDFESFREAVRTSAFEVQAAEARVEEARAALERNRSRVLPRLDASVGVVRNDREIQISLPEVPGISVDPPIFQYETVARASADLRAALLEPSWFSAQFAARTRVEAAGVAVQVTADQVERLAVELFFQVAEIQAMVDAAHAVVQTRLAHHERLLAAFSVGSATELQVQQALLDVMDAEAARDDLQYALDEVLRGAQRLLGADTTPILQGEPSAPPASPARNADVHLARLQRQSSESWYRSLGLDFAPRIVGSGTINYVSAPYIDGQNHAWQIGVALQWQLYAGGTRTAARREARAQLEQATLNARRLELELAIDAADGSEDIERARNERERAEARVVVANEAARLAALAFDSGMLSAEDRLDAELASVHANALATVTRLRERLAAWRVILR
jgi:outer membrane protein TolC